MPTEPAPIQDGDELGAAWLMGWLAYLRALARQATVTIKEGCGLSLRRTSDGTEIGLELPRYSIGVTTSGVSGRSGTTPGSGDAQPYRFDGTRYVPVGAPIVVFNKSKQAIKAGFWVSWNALDGFPHLDWSDCTAG